MTWILVGPTTAVMQKHAEKLFSKLRETRDTFATKWHFGGFSGKNISIRKFQNLRNDLVNVVLYQPMLILLI